MHDEEAFVRAICEAPHDDAPRLVYADWLEERGDPRAEYLRAETELARLPFGATEAHALRARLWDAWARVDPRWLSTFTQPGLLRANPTPYPSAWRGPGLGRLRPSDSCYGTWPYGSLPTLPVELFCGEFQWLDPAPADRIAASEAGLPQEFVEATRRAHRARINREPRLPPSFRRFMLSDELRLAISGTGCVFTSAGAGRDATGGLWLTFLADYQYVVLWDLFVHPSGAHCVVAHPPGPEVFDNGEVAEVEEQPPAEGYFVAPSFEAIVYRLWAESVIDPAAYDSIVGPGENTGTVPLPILAQEYVEHYARRLAGGR